MIQEGASLRPFFLGLVQSGLSDTCRLFLFDGDEHGDDGV